MSNLIVRVVGNNLAGGARKYCFLLNKELIRLNRTVVTFIPKAPIRDDLSDADLTGMPYVNTRNWWKVAKYIISNRSQIDYVHLHLRNVIIWFYPLLFILKVRYFVTVHAPNNKIDSLKQRVYSFLYKTSLISSNHVIFISQYVKNQTLSALKLRESQISSSIVYNGSADPLVQKFYSLEKNVIDICIVGELTERKGILNYAEIVKKMQRLNGNYVFNFYGEGPLRKFLEELRDSAIVPKNVKINVQGYAVNLHEVFLFNDIHLIISKGEAFGRVVTEAMGYGVPTLAITDGAFPELINNGVDGWLADHIDDLVSIFGQIEMKKIQEIGRHARSKFDMFFESNISTQKTLNVISSR